MNLKEQLPNLDAEIESQNMDSNLLAGITGMKPNHVEKILSGTLKNISCADLYLIAKALSRDIDYILAEELVEVDGIQIVELLDAIQAKALVGCMTSAIAREVMRLVRISKKYRASKALYQRLSVIHSFMVDSQVRPMETEHSAILEL